MTLTGYAGAELVWELGQQVVIDSVFSRPQDDDGTSVVHYRQRDRKFYSYLLIINKHTVPGGYRDLFMSLCSCFVSLCGHSGPLSNSPAMV